MRKFSVILITLLVMFSTSIADVTKKSVSTTNFFGMGELTTYSTVYLKGNKQMVVSDQDFKGKGMLGRMFGMIFRGGEKGELIDLDSQKVYHIEYDKNRYTSTPLQQLVEKLEDYEKNNEVEEDKERDIEIIKNEIRVENLNQTETIAGYSCNGYKIIWDFESREKNGDNHIAIRGIITLWNAPEDAQLSKLKSEEIAFSKAYARAIGLDEDLFTENMLGLNWFKIFNKMQSSRGNQSEKNTPMLTDEAMKKLKAIKGYPLKTVGIFKMKNMNPEKNSIDEDKNQDFKIPKGLGGLFGKKNKKENEESEDGFKTLFEFSSVVQSFSLENIPDSQIGIPEGFKEK